jgi:hypothetical protein
MKALSGRQPWWWAILHAGKDVENRTWSTKHRGTLLLHASDSLTVPYYNEALVWMRERFGAKWVKDNVPRLEMLPHGGIVGRVDIVDVIEPCGGKCGRQWHMHEQFGFLLRNVKPLPFVACKGRLNVFDVKLDLVEWARLKEAIV